MKTSSNELFELVKSLDPKEKAYFKTYKGYGVDNSDYIRLFDIINAQKENYNEEKLKAKLNDRSKLKNFKHTKSRLTEAILKCLENYYSLDSIDIQLQNLAHRIDILQKKKLNKTAEKILIKAEKMALEHGKYDYLLILFSMKVQHMVIHDDVDSLRHFMNSEIQKEQIYLERLKNQIEYRNLSAKLKLVGSRVNMSSFGKERSDIKQFRKHPLLASPRMAVTFQSLQLYYQIQINCDFRNLKLTEVTYENTKKLVRHIESKPQLLKAYADNYLGALSKLIVLQSIFCKEHEMEITYKKAHAFYYSLPSKNRNNYLLSVFVIIGSNYVASLTSLNLFKKALALWEEIRKLSPFNILNNTSQVVLTCNLFFVYFFLGRYHDALKWVNKLYDKSYIGIATVKLIEMKLWILITHYELENYEQLHYFSKSILNYVKKHKMLGAFEKIVLDFFKKNTLNIGSKSENKRIFIHLKSELNKIKTNNIFFLLWVESKIQSRPILGVTGEKSAAI